MPFSIKIASSIAGCALLIATTILNAVAQNPTYSTRMEVVHGKPYVMVMVNGHGPFRFLVDTGTGAEALVSMELAEELALPTVGHARLSDPSRKGDHLADIVMIESLNVAGAEFPEIKAVRHRIYGEDGTCQGILGFTLFEDYLLTLDYPAQRMTLATGELAADGENSVLPFRMQDEVPIVPLHIGNQLVEAELDSAGIGLSLPENLAAQLKFSVDPYDFGHGESLSSRFLIKAATLNSDVHLGQYTFAQPFVEINSAFPLINFGSCPMQNFVVTFDQINLLVRIQANQKTFHLAATPSAIRMQNAPKEGPPELELVPIG